MSPDGHRSPDGRSATESDHSLDGLDRFDRVDWRAIDAEPSRRLSRRTATFLVGLLFVCAAFVYDHETTGPHDALVGQWDPAQVEWLFVVSLLALACYLVWPLLADRDATRRRLAQLRESPPAIVGLGWLVAFFLVGLVGPAFVAKPELNVFFGYNPPALFSVDVGLVVRCAGEVANGRCHGSLRFPLGTTRGGKDLLALVVLGARVSLVVAMVTSMILVPLATAVGTTAAYLGGRVDEALFRYVDVQQTVPAFFVYIILLYLYGRSLFLFVLVYGLFNWGSVARLVRSAALSEVESPYVRAAESAGASDLQVLRRHVIPNVGDTALTAATLQIPTLILAEAAFSFLDLLDPHNISWGQLISESIAYTVRFPWATMIPGVVLFVTALSFNVVGDALRDVLDPRREG